MAAISLCSRLGCDHSAVGYGEILEGHQEHRTIPTRQKVSQVALAIFASLVVIGASSGIAFIVAGVSGIAIGAAIGVAIAVTTVASAVLHIVNTKHSRNPPSTSSLKFPDDVPPLGKFHGGHDVLVTKDSKETTKWKWDLIDHVEHSLELLLSIGGGPSFCRALNKIRVLLEKKPHVKVHLITVGTMLEKEDIKLLKGLAQDYPENFRYCITPAIPEWLPKLRVVEPHPKIMVVDEKYFVTGGTNWQEELIHEGLEPPTWRKGQNWVQNMISAASRDMDVVGCGPIAKTLRREFFKLFANWEYRAAVKKPEGLNNYYEPIPKGAKRARFAKFEEHPDVVHGVRIKPLVYTPENSFNNCTDEYVKVINSAKKIVRLANLYFIPVPSIAKAIEAASDRCRVDLITNSTGQKSPPSGKLYVPCCRQNYPLVMKTEKTKNRIFEFNVPNTVYHKKVMTVDGVTAIVGSYNIGPKSHTSDYEITLTFDSEEVAKRIDVGMDADIAEADSTCINNDLEKGSGTPRKYVRELSYQEVKKMTTNLWPRFIGGLENRFLARFV